MNYSESYVRENIENMDSWEIFQIFIDNHYSENFLREVWSYIAPTGAIERFHKLSLDFLREMEEDIFWEDIFQYNRHYTKEERDVLYKEFNLDRKFNFI